MDLVRGVPIDTRLELTAGAAGNVAKLGLAQDGRCLAQATITRGHVPPADPSSAVARWRAFSTPTGEIPGTATCLACGAVNPLGLAIRFCFNDHLLWREYMPRETYRAHDGSLHPALAMIILDELGWWLGALRQAECGVTTEIEMTVFRPLPFAPLLVIGDRGAVRPDDAPRGRYVRAEGFLLTREGELLAAGHVRFAGSRAYTRRLVEPFLEVTDADILCELFPSARTRIPPKSSD